QLLEPGHLAPFGFHSSDHFGELLPAGGKGFVVISEVVDVEGGDYFFGLESIGEDIDIGPGAPVIDLVGGIRGLADIVGNGIVAGHAAIKAAVVFVLINLLSGVKNEVFVVFADWPKMKVKSEKCSNN